jgi:hypothetical protein
MTTIVDVASSLSSLVANSRDQRITGVELSVLIRHKFPDFSPELHGCRNLRAFIRQYALSICEVGRSGADVIYGVRPSTQAPPISSAVEVPTMVPESTAGVFRTNTYISSAVWKTFVSPVSPFKLYANTETGALEVIPPGTAPLESPWVPIPPCSAELHRQIARDFIPSLSDEASRKLLESTLTISGSWWKSYYSIVQQLALDTRWNQFRRRRIVHELESALKAYNVPLSGARDLSSTRRPLSPQRLPNRPTFTADASATAIGTDEDSRLRSLAVDVVRKMPAADLRDLKVPLGYVIDVLAVRRD